MEVNRPDDIDKLFKKGLQHSQRKPPKAVWNNIENTLNKDDRRMHFVRLRFGLWVAALLILLVGGTELYTRPPAKNALVAHNNPRSGSKMRTASRTGERSGGLTQQIPVGKKDNPDKVARRLFLRKQMEPTDAKNALFLRRSQLDMPIQPVGSGAQMLTGPPPERAFTVRPVTAKKASSLVTLQRLRHWALIGFYSNEFAGYNLTDQDSITANGKEIDKKEKHVLSTMALVLVDYKFSSHWVIETGLGYSRAKSHANPTTSYAVKNNGEIKFQVNTLSGYGYVPATPSTPAHVGDSVVTEHSTTTLHYLNAPFMLSYALHFKKFTLMPGVGFSLNLLTAATLETKLQNASYDQHDFVVKMYGLKRINYGVLLKTELGYAFDPHWSIAMVASFKNSLTPINLHTVVATYPYNLGVGAGMRYSF